jgi:hypothetical protein
LPTGSRLIRRASGVIVLVLRPHTEGGIMAMRRVLLLLVLAGGLVAAGCGQREDSATTSEGAAQSEHGTEDSIGVPAPAPSGTVEEVLVQLRQLETELSQIIEEGRIGEVHDKAEAMGQLLSAASERSTGLSIEQQAALKARSDAAARIADAMHDAGDRGDLGATKVEFEKLKVELRAVEELLNRRTSP